VKTITLRQTLLLHEYMIRKHGGSSGVRDMAMLKSAIYRPFASYGGDDLYQDIYLKAGALIQSVVKNHPFIDGNKRTAFVAAYAFLKLNRIQMIISNAKVTKFMVRVSKDNLSVDEISDWLKKNSKEI
jgi:death on curing protein